MATNLSAIGTTLSVASPTQIANPIDTSTPSPTNPNLGGIGTSISTASPTQIAAGTAPTYVNPNMALQENTGTAPGGTPASSTPGLTGASTTQTGDKYKAALDQATGTAPSSPGEGASKVADALSQSNQDQQQQQAGEEQAKAVTTALQNNEGYQKLIDDHNAQLQTQAQQPTLEQEYTKLSSDLGLPALNTQLINMKSIMDGTEDDIRSEITKAGGFATNSQVLALTAARNKTMIQNYNNLLQTRDDAVSQINTMIGLSEKDRAIATQQASDQLNFDKDLLDYQDKMTQNAKDAYDKIITTPGYGYQALYASAGGDAHTVSLIEDTLGLQPGQLQQLAQSANSNSQWGQTYSLGGNIVQKNNQTGEIRTVVSGGGSGGGTGGTNDPQTQAWVSSILNGNSTMQQVPTAYRNAVAMAMANAPADSYSPLAASRFATAANKIATNYVNLPQYQLTANGLPYLQRIDAAIKTPGSISDQDLLDSLTKLNTAGNAISDAQVKLITDGKSFSDMANTFKNKFSNGGVLSDNQRSQIQSIAKAIFANYQKGYQPVFDKVTAQMDAAGIPKAFQNVPDLNNLSNQATNNQTDSTPSSLPPDVQTKISGNLSFSSDGKTAYLPRSIWSTLGENMDAVLKEAQQEGFTLLIQ